MGGMKIPLFLVGGGATNGVLFPAAHALLTHIPVLFIAPDALT